jgi:serine protease SohB
MNWSLLFADILGFLVKTGILALAIGGLILLIAYLSQMKGLQPSLKVENWTEKWELAEKILQAETLEKDELKEIAKQEKIKTKNEAKAAKEAAKNKTAASQTKPRIFLLHFDGDIQASAVVHLKNEINSLLTMAKAGDEVVLQLESPGGVVHGYGLAAAELQRLRDAGLTLTICIDKVGASGGYMMAVVGNKILAAPFAIIGSIGVLSQVPNFHRLLKKHDVDYKEYTAGEYKTTVSLLGEITPEKESKFLEMMQGTHDLFKNHVGKYRPNLELAKVTTGEYWYGTQALGLGLIDEIRTSDDYLFSKRTTHKMIFVKHEKKKTLSEKLNISSAQLLSFVNLFRSPQTALNDTKPWDQLR